MRINPNAPAPKIDPSTGLPPTKSGRGVGLVPNVSPEVLEFFRTNKAAIAWAAGTSISK